MAFYDGGELPDDDGDPLYQVISRNEHRARKLHRCDVCEGAVLPGQRYRKERVVEDDGLRIYKSHLDRAECQAAEQAVLAGQHAADEQCGREAEAAYLAQLTPEELAHTTLGYLGRLPEHRDVLQRLALKLEASSWNHLTHGLTFTHAEQDGHSLLTADLPLGHRLDLRGRDYGLPREYHTVTLNVVDTAGSTLYWLRLQDSEVSGKGGTLLENGDRKERS